MSDLSATNCGCSSTYPSNNCCSGNNWVWIILLVFLMGGNNCLGGSNCGCGCSTNGNSSCDWIIWILLLSTFCGDGCGCGCN